MPRLIAALVLSCLPAVALAQAGWRSDDRAFSATDLGALLSGQVVAFFDGSKAYYDADGSYRYTYRDGDPPFRGTYETNDDSAVCVAFDNGFSRCDAYVRNGERLVLITADGLRFPVREMTPEPPHTEP